ncbi:hypothetical protein LH128_06892 [Sphingomonas sp. LH128]|uniref:glycosyltransferase n=1 Tax=Sphingomonas sp. LH128 TaxID=473781 RepID=UPI00027CBBE8|nr:glycosyltransferase [Sphingomonas sp. LH128]EJU13802.1 hypothetical protein LH128_06892 [Sphingomonas sp. LH128]
MRPVIFLFPHDRMDIGGNSAQARFVAACRGFGHVQVASYEERVAGWLYLDDVLEDPAVPAKGASAPMFIVHWGPDVARLLDRLVDRDVIYFAHSTGWGMAMPPRVPILCVSRHTMAFWGRHAPNSYIALVPNIVDIRPWTGPSSRDIDVLVQVRKSSRYLLEKLVPALETCCNVIVLDGWVDDLGSWFGRSKVYLYDSLEHWAGVGATEGFGLPPIEAMGHGCIVFSSVNDALADYLDPGFNCRKIRVHSLAWDVAAILQAVKDGAPAPMQGEGFQMYAPENVADRMAAIFRDIEQFFALVGNVAPDIEDIWAQRQPTALQRAKRAVRILAGV